MCHVECAHVPAGAGLPATYVPAWIVSQPKEGAQSRPSAEADYHTYLVAPQGQQYLQPCFTTRRVGKVQLDRLAGSYSGQVIGRSVGTGPRRSIDSGSIPHVPQGHSFG